MSASKPARKTAGFLEIIQAKHAGQYSGDQYGGSSGSDGSGLPLANLGNFMFATGIECSNPMIDNGRTRRDLLEECWHYQHWREDPRLVKSLGLRVLRYGLRYHRVHASEKRYVESHVGRCDRAARGAFSLCGFGSARVRRLERGG